MNENAQSLAGRQADKVGKTQTVLATATGGFLQIAFAARASDLRTFEQLLDTTAGERERRLLRVLAAHSDAEISEALVLGSLRGGRAGAAPDAAAYESAATAMPEGSKPFRRNYKM